METPLYKLGLMIAAAVILPAITYVLGIIWFKLVGALELERTWRMICILLPMFVFGMTVAIRFDIVRGAWEQSPALASIILFAIAIGSPSVLVPIAVSLWRSP